MTEIKANNSRYFFIILLVAMVVFVFLIIKPFFITIITSAILAYMFYPLYRFINKKLKRKNLSALITTVLIILIITLPLIFAMNAVAKEARINYLLIKQRIISGDIFSSDCDTDSALCRISVAVMEFTSEPKTKYYMDNANERITTYIVNGISKFLFSIPIIFINLFIMLFIMFYLFRDGLTILKKIEQLSPLKKLHYKRILKKFDDVIHSVVFGYILIAVIEGCLGILILFLLGVRAPILLGLVIAFFAVIPVIGPPLVWLPIALLMIIDGYATQTNLLLVKGIILILYGALVIGPVDTLLKPKIIGDKAKVHPILVLLGVLGGLKMFGFVGVIIGPVILAIFMTFLRIYEEEKGVLFK